MQGWASLVASLEEAPLNRQGQLWWGPLGVRLMTGRGQGGWRWRGAGSEESLPAGCHPSSEEALLLQKS